jgi:hypothetical protein
MKEIAIGSLDELLHEAFADFWLRINAEIYGPLTRIMLEEIAIQYFIALDQAIGHQKKTPLTGLLISKCSPPPEFLPIIAEIIIGVQNKKGRPNDFTYGERLNLFYEINKKIILSNISELEAMKEITSEYHNFYSDGKDITKTLQRIMEELKDEVHIVNHLLLRKQNTPIIE